MDKKESKSKFFLVKCQCGNEQVVFSNVTKEVECLICKKKLAEPTGGKSLIFGKIIKSVDR